MDIERIRELRLAHPFKPFKLVMSDGRDLLVDRSFYLAISPNGQHMIWSSRDGGWQRVDPKQVSAAEFVPPRSFGTRRKKAGENGG